MKENFTVFCLGIALTILPGLVTNSNAQAIARQSIASLGSVSTAGTLTIRQTVGQAYSTRSQKTGLVATFRPGFLQPYTPGKPSVADAALNFQVSTFPNPASSTLYLRSAKTIGQAHLQVTDLQGRVMLTRDMENFKQESIMCSDWPEGIYVLSLLDDNHQKFISKIIVAK